MPEYLALVHHHNQSSGEGNDVPPSVEEVESGLLRMERLGIARIH